MRQGIVVGDLDARLFRILLGDSAEELVVLLVPCSQEDEAEIHLHEVLDAFPQQIEPLLIGQAGDDGNEGMFIQGPRKLKFLQKILLAFYLSREILFVVVGRNEGIGLGIPLLVIGAIEDAVEILAPIAEDTVQPAAKFRGLNLPAVVKAYSIDDVGKDDSRLQEVDLSPIFNSPPVIDLPVKPRGLQPPLIEYPLVGNVVNGE